MKFGRDIIGSRLASLAVFVASLMLLAACQTAQKTDPKVLQQARLAEQQLFSSPGSFQPQFKGAAAEVADFILQGLSGRFNNGDVDGFGSLLSPGFQRRLMLNQTEMLTSPDQAALLLVRQNRNQATKVSYRLQSIKVADNGQSAVAVALSSYDSQYFGPRFLETLHIVKPGGSWKLAQQSLVPLYPTVPELHKVSIFVTERYWKKGTAGSFTDYYGKQAKSHGPEAALADLQKNGTSFDGNVSYSVAAIRQSVKIGSEVTIEAQFHRARGDIDFHVSSFTVRKFQPNLVFSVTGVPTDSRALEVLVYVDGIQIGQRYVERNKKYN